jgi:hypothetical protein
MTIISRGCGIGRSMSHATLNMPTNSSSADGSRVVLVSGARVPPMRSIPAVHGGGKVKVTASATGKRAMETLDNCRSAFSTKIEQKIEKNA